MPEKPGAELTELPDHTLGLQIHMQLMLLHGMGYPISDLHALVISSQNQTENVYQTVKDQISREDFYKTHNPFAGLALSDIYQIQYNTQTHGYCATRAPLPEKDTPEYEQFVHVFANLGEFLAEVKKRERLNFPVALNILEKNPQETLLVFARRAIEIQGYSEDLRTFHEAEILMRAENHINAHLRYGDAFPQYELDQLSTWSAQIWVKNQAGDKAGVHTMFMGTQSEAPELNILAQMYARLYPETEALLFRPDPSEQPV